jgi:hypothetical protein
LHLEFDLANSFSINGTTVTFTPTIVTGTNAIAAQIEEGRRFELIGKVTAASSSSISVAAGDTGTTFTFVVDAGTTVEGGISVASIVAGTPVLIYGRTMPDGTLSAKLIAVIENRNEDSTRDGGEGLVTSVTCNGPNGSCTAGGLLSVTSFNIVVRRSWHPDNIGKVMTVTVASTTTFKAGFAAQAAGDTQAFDGTQIFPGQALWLVGSLTSSSPLTVKADFVELSHQGMLGTVSTASPTGTDPNYTFTYAPNASAPFLKLSGASSVTVKTNNNTLYAGTVSESSFTSTAVSTNMIVRGFMVCTPGTGGNCNTANGTITDYTWKIRGF